MPKIALSARFWDNPAVNAVLRGCDHIYTTQIERSDVLLQEFGDKVHFVPNTTAGMVALIKNWHPNSEYITAAQLIAARRGQEQAQFGDSYPPVAYELPVPYVAELTKLVKFYVYRSENDIEIFDNYDDAKERYLEVLGRAAAYVALRYAVQLGQKDGKPNLVASNTIVSHDAA